MWHVPQQIDPSRVGSPEQPIQRHRQHRADAAQGPDRREQPIVWRFEPGVGWRGHAAL
jgi:hypothetical protein